VAVTEGLVREEQLLHDLCLLGATTVEITQMLTRAEIKITSEPLLRLEPGLVVWQSLFKNTNREKYTLRKAYTHTHTRRGVHEHYKVT
jgi:hypothetical protein